METETKQKSDIMIPVAIVLAAVIIGVSVIFTNNVKQNKNIPKDNSNAVQQEQDAQIKLNPVTDKDHIRGNINAPIKIVEFSDIECPFCKMFHQTLKKIVSEYGSDKVAWVYRHSPIMQLHPKAFQEANATECVAEIGGEQKFWQFLDLMYERTPSNNQFNLDNLSSYAEEVGINKDEFNKCQNSLKFKDKINDQIKQMASALGKGTPHSILVTPKNEFVPIVGAQSYERVKSIIDDALNSK